MVQQPPAYSESKERETLSKTALHDTLNVEREDQGFTGDWISLSAFGTLHHRSFFKADGEVVDVRYPDIFRYRRTLDTFEYPNVQKIRFYEKQGIEAMETVRSLEAHAATTDLESGVVTYGPSESFWQALGQQALADQGYVVVHERLAGTWTSGLPDSMAFQLGELQTVLADIGIVPGGATLPEIELRSIFNEFSSESVSAERAVGAVEVKKEGKAADGVRQLSSHRDGGKKKPPYLDSNTVEKGWLVCPKAADKIQQKDRIGGITWNKQGRQYVDPPQVTAETEAKEQAIETVQKLVLDAALRHQSLDRPLTEAIKKGISRPDYLYDIFE